MHCAICVSLFYYQRYQHFYHFIVVLLLNLIFTLTDNYNTALYFSLFSINYRICGLQCTLDK